ncbi:MAG: hypothetical protein ACLS43_01490 [Evtepia gabavorous]
MKSWSASRSPGIVCQTTGCGWTPYDLGELAMLLPPGRLTAGFRKSGRPARPARQLGRHGLVRRAGDSEVRHGPGWGGEQPAQRIFCPAKGFTRRQVYEAFRE